MIMSMDGMMYNKIIMPCILMRKWKLFREESNNKFTLFEHTVNKIKKFMKKLFMKIKHIRLTLQSLSKKY